MNQTWSEAASETADSLATPFEDWCAARGLHPEAFGAWECFEASQREESLRVDQRR